MLRMEVSKDYVAKDGEKVFDEEYDGRILRIRESDFGMVAATGERNGYDDSDFFAWVYDAKKDTFDQVEYATTRGWTYANGATIDATPEVAKKFEEFMEARAKAYRDFVNLRRAKEVRKGKTVKVVRGRKVPLDTTGVVIWTGADKWGKGRIGLKTAAGVVHFTAESNVEVVLETAVAE